MIEPRETELVVPFERGEVRGGRARTNAEDQPVAADLLEREHPVREIQRLVQGHLKDRRANLHVLGHRRRHCQRNKRVADHEATADGLSRPEARKSFASIGSGLLGQGARLSCIGDRPEQCSQFHRTPGSYPLMLL